MFVGMGLQHFILFSPKQLIVCHASLNLSTKKQKANAVVHRIYPFSSRYSMTSCAASSGLTSVVSMVISGSDGGT